MGWKQKSTAKWADLSVNPQRVLVLSGPAGSGKSTLVKVLSEQDNLNFELVHWKNEDMQSGMDSDYYWDRGRYAGHESFDVSGNEIGSCEYSCVSRSPPPPYWRTHNCQLHFLINLVSSCRVPLATLFLPWRQMYTMTPLLKLCLSNPNPHSRLLLAG